MLLIYSSTERMKMPLCGMVRLTSITLTFYHSISEQAVKGLWRPARPWELNTICMCGVFNRSSEAYNIKGSM